VISSWGGVTGGGGATLSGTIRNPFEVRIVIPDATTLLATSSAHSEFQTPPHPALQSGVLLVPKSGHREETRRRHDRRFIPSHSIHSIRRSPLYKGVPLAQVLSALLPRQKSGASPPRDRVVLPSSPVRENAPPECVFADCTSSAATRWLPARGSLRRHGKCTPASDTARHGSATNKHAIHPLVSSLSIEANTGAPTNRFTDAVLSPSQPGLQTPCTARTCTAPHSSVIYVRAASADAGPKPHEFPHFSVPLSSPPAWPTSPVCARPAQPV